MPVDHELLDAGRRLHQSGQYAEAQQAYHRALAADPHNADVLNLLGAVCINLEQWDDAARYLADAMRENPRHAAAHENWGVFLARQNRFAEAVASFQTAVALNPNAAQAQMNLACALVHNGQTTEATEAFRRVVTLAPDTRPAHEELARAYYQQQRLPEAIFHIQHMIRLSPDDPRAYFDLAMCTAQCGQTAVAIEAYRQTLRLRPDSAESCVNLANLLSEQNELEEAVALYRRALELRPQFAEALINLGRVLNNQQKFDEAITALEAAIRLKPDMTAGYNNLGISLGEQGRFAEAAECYGKALTIRPDDADLLYNRGIAVLKQGYWSWALEHFEHALRIKPDYAEAHHNHSATLLLTGQLTEGFAEYEWRFRSRDFIKTTWKWPVWDGSDLAGRTIVLCAEQGLGDTLQFVRYAPLLGRRGARVIVACQPVLHPILARTAGVDSWIAQSGTPPQADYCAPIMSLPHLTQATLETIPADVPYLFADPDLVAQWRQRMADVSGLRVGIAWQGNAKCPGDAFRSIALARYAPLADVSGVRLVNLQKGPGSEQLADFANRWPVIDYGESVDTTSGAFMDTAAIMKNLDLVITSDTATAHLAGALGVRTWVALAYAPDWRWLLEREDSPWYPTMRLFRQTVLNDWSGVFERMAAELAAIVAERHAIEAPQTL